MEVGIDAKVCIKPGIVSQKTIDVKTDRTLRLPVNPVLRLLGRHDGTLMEQMSRCSVQIIRSAEPKLCKGEYVKASRVEVV